MAGFTIVHMDDFERPFPKWALARKSLGLQSFGMNVVELPPGETIPEHTEVESDQEEVFIVLVGRRDDGHRRRRPSGAGGHLRAARPGAAADGREPERRRRDRADRLRTADERLHAAGLGVARCAPR